MYLKTSLISFLKVKNVILLLIGLFLVFTGMADIVSLIVYYFGDWKTVIFARSTPEAICAFCVGVIMLVIAAVSRNGIREATFYSSYFENNLYGNVWYTELSIAAGCTVQKVRSRLHTLRSLYMKRFSFVSDSNGEHIELFSKTVSCSCRNCGAALEKKEYFAGICPYCKTSDVFASVLTDNKIYNITADTQGVRTNRNYYLKRNSGAKMGLITGALSLASAFLLIFLLVIMDQASNYNDQDYLRDLLLSGKSYSSYELIKKDILDGIVWDIFFAAILLPVVVICIRKLAVIIRAGNFAQTFSAAYSPFLSIDAIGKNSSALVLKKTIESGYLKNCTIENHDGEIMISLAKKIIKDHCPYCGAPIVGAVGADYICSFCQNRIMKVIDKK